jgi:hypothetical protein
MSRRRWLLAVVLSGLLIGCSPSGNATSSASSGALATASAPASPSPTAVVSPSPSAAALPQSSEPLTLDPALFAGLALDNPYWPMKVGSAWVYRSTDADGAVQKVEITVTDKTKQILGITATVVHDIVTEDGETVEDTLDWYAQDATGNLWYLGEDTKEYDGGKVVSTEGSWEAGVDGAQPGILLPADPAVGMAYRQEYYAGQAEDAAEVLSLAEHVKVPFGTFDGALQTKETTALEPDLVEQKFYAKGVGNVLSIDISGGSGREELLSFEPG